MALLTRVLRRLAWPIIVLLVLLSWQLFFLPRRLPKSHYEVLGVKHDASVEEITNVYRHLTLSWDLQMQRICGIPQRMIEIQHAYAVLSNPLRRRDYDHFGVDELQEVIGGMLKNCDDAGSDFQLLLESFHYEPFKSKIHSMTLQNFRQSFEGKEAFLLQIYSLASINSQKFAQAWEEISVQLDGVATVRAVELGEIQLATLFAEKNKVTGFPFFRYGLPTLIAFPPNCRDLDCLMRYSGVMTVDMVVNWVATKVLGLPQILYYSPQTLVTNFIQKSGPHKVKVLIFSVTGERAVPFLRHASKEYWQYAAFGLVLWHEENATFWERMLGLESAPAVLFLRDPGLQPDIYYGNMNSSFFKLITEEHKTHVLPQLRSITAMELGCHEAGYSRAGKEITTWYCVIVAGRPGFELSQMRSVLRGVQDSLRNEALEKEHRGGHFQSLSVAASTFIAKRLTLAWLDGETQKDVCYFYLHSDTVYETCGRKQYQEMNDVPQIFIVRYRRDRSAEERVLLGKKKHFSSIWNKVLQDDEGLASQIVARYNGSNELPEITSWISDMITEGDLKDLLHYKKKAPDLVPEDPNPSWLQNAQHYVSRTTEGLFERRTRAMHVLLDYMKEPKFISVIVLIVSLYMSSSFFRPNQNNLHNEQQVSTPATKNEHSQVKENKAMTESLTGNLDQASVPEHQLTDDALKQLSKDSSHVS
eukprot:c28236_g1_i1 orf=101-2203(+)